MKFCFRTLLILGGFLFLSACSFGVSVAGTVVDMLSGQPVGNATVRLFRNNATVSATGCFATRQTMDRSEIELSVSAPGYKSVVIRPAKTAPGSYEARVALVPENSVGESKGVMEEISQSHYEILARACPVWQK